MENKIAPPAHNRADLRALIATVEAEAERRGISPTSLCRAATDNPRLYERLFIRAAMTEYDTDRILDWIARMPPKSKAKVKA